MWIYLYFLALAFLTTWLAMPLAGSLGRRLRLMDEPGPRKVHVRPIPLTGGLIIFGIFATILAGHFVAFALWADRLSGMVPGTLSVFGRNLPGLISRIACLTASGAAIFVLGFLDDRCRLGVGIRLIVQFGAAALAVLGGVQPIFEAIPYWLGAAISIIWVVAIINAFNLVDGLDGLAPGLAIVAGSILAFALHVGYQPQGVVVLMALVGCMVGFLMFNYHPASIFLGSSGAMTAGHVLGSMTIYLGALRGATVDVQAFCIPLLLMAMPLYDTASVIYLRVVHGMPITRADNRHFHHRLLAMGFSHRQAVAFIWLLALIAGLPVIPLLQLDRAMSLALLGQVFAMCLALIVIERAYNNLFLEPAKKRLRATSSDGSIESRDRTATPL